MNYSNRQRVRRKSTLIIEFFYFSNVLNDVKASVYKDFCAQREKKLDVCLVSDLTVRVLYMQI